MIKIEEISLQKIDKFWDEHLKYLIEDEMLSNEEEVLYFSGREYRGILEDHMIRDKDKQHMAYFYYDSKKIGAISYCTYQSEDGKCFILDYWIFPEFRGNGLGHQCFEAFEKYTKLNGAIYYELNSFKENSIRFWKSLGFIEKGKDEHNMLLFIKN